MIFQGPKTFNIQISINHMNHKNFFSYTSSCCTLQHYYIYSFVSVVPIRIIQLTLRDEQEYYKNIT